MAATTAALTEKTMHKSFSSLPHLLTHSFILHSLTHSLTHSPTHCWLPGLLSSVEGMSSP